MAEIEALFAGDVYVVRDTIVVGERRMLGFGNDAGRWIFCVFTWRGDRIRPVSVRFMHDTEVTLMSKKFPDLKSDEDADSWLQDADLAEYDLSGMKKVRFELARKDAIISLRLPAALLATLKANAAKANMPTQRLIRMMIEAQLGQASAKPRRKARVKVAAPKRSGKRAA